MNFIQLGGGRVMDAATGEIFDSAPSVAAPSVAPVAPTNFTPYTLGGALDPAITKYLQDSVAYNTANGSGYGGAGGSFDVGNGNYVLPVVQPNVSESGTGPNEGQQYTSIAAHSSAPYKDGKLGYAYDPSGNLVTSFDDAPYKHDALEYGAMALLAAISGGAAAGALGIGAGAAGAGGAGAAEGAAAAGGIGDATAAGYAGLDAASASTLGGGASGAWGGGLGAAGGAGAMGAGASFLPETVSEGFGPAFESWASQVPQGWQLPVETVSEGFGPQFEQQVQNMLPPTPSLPQTPPTPSSPPAAPPAASPPGVPPPANPELQGVPPPANPMTTPTNPLSNLFPNGQVPGWVGPAISAAGGLLGSQGTQASQTQTQTLDPRLDAAVYGSGGLVPGVQGLLAGQAGQTQANAAQMSAVGSNLLGRPISSGGPVTMGAAPAMPTSQVAPNGATSGAVQYNAPTTASNPYLASMADDLQRRTADFLGQNNAAIAGNFVATGGLGGSRQGIAQGLAASKAADSLQGQLAGLYGSAYEADANRALSRYGQDLGFYTNQRNTDAALRAQDLSTYDNAAARNLQKYGLDQSYATAGRQQDLQGATLGAGLLAQGQQAQWNPYQNAANIFSALKTNNTTNSTNSGGGWQGALGGLLGGAQFAQNMGLFGNGANGASTAWW